MNKIYLIPWKAKLDTDTLWSLVVFRAVFFLLYIMVLFFTVHELCTSIRTHARKTFLAPHIIMYFVYVLMYFIVMLSEIFQRNTRMLIGWSLFVSICNIRQVMVMNATVQRLRRSCSFCYVNSPYLSRNANSCLLDFKQASSEFDRNDNHLNRCSPE